MRTLIAHSYMFHLLIRLQSFQAPGPHCLGCCPQQQHTPLLHVLVRRLRLKVCLVCCRQQQTHLRHGLRPLRLKACLVLFVLIPVLKLYFLLVLVRAQLRLSLKLALCQQSSCLGFKIATKMVVGFEASNATSWRAGDKTLL